MTPDAESPPAADLPETTVCPPPPPPAGLPRRRRTGRVAAPPGARAEVRRWADGPNPDLAVRLVEVSAAGMRVRLRQAVRAGESLDVVLWDPAGRRCGRVLAVARWSVSGADGAVTAGLEFARRIPAAYAARLAGGSTSPPPVPGVVAGGIRADAGRPPEPLAVPQGLAQVEAGGNPERRAAVERGLAAAEALRAAVNDQAKCFALRADAARLLRRGRTSGLVTPKMARAAAGPRRAGSVGPPDVHPPGPVEDDLGGRHPEPVEPPEELAGDPEVGGPDGPHKSRGSLGGDRAADAVLGPVRR